ncbi:MAG: hypothetical protein HFJ06_01845 [Lachnospiraceae bacterium]|nr:hypothetical protein [Lachnospiraceae bacterium]
MKEIIAAVLTAGATLIAAALMYSSRINKLLDQVEQLKKEFERCFGENKEQISRECMSLVNGHRELSGGHKELSKEHKELSKEHGDLKDEIHRVIVYQESEKTARETAARKLPDETGLLRMVNAVFENNKKLQKENARLNARMAVLQQENAKLRVQAKPKLQGMEDFSIDDMDLFDDSYDGPEL